MFRAVIEYFCGVKPGYDGFTIEPCLPTEWNDVKIHRVLRGKAYEIAIKRDGKTYQIEVAGAPYKGKIAY